MPTPDPELERPDAGASPHPARAWWLSLLGLLLVGAVGGAGWTHLQRARGQALRRACDLKIKQLREYNESFGGFLSALLGPGQRVAAFTEKERTLLQEAAPDFDPTDPGSGRDSWRHYLMTDAGLFCLRHGFQSSPEGVSRDEPAREQLRAAGFTDAGLLARASSDPPDLLAALHAD